MPELPEVETVARGLQAALAGRTIVAVQVLWPRTVVDMEPAAFAERLAGQTIVRVGRRGKWVVLTLASGQALLVHLRMTGRLLVEEGACGDEQHVRVRLALDDGRCLCFRDARKFGRMALVDDPAPVLGELGPEPLGDDFTLAWLRGLLAGRRGRIKPLLLNQRVLAGLGNIYTDEVLFRARLSPRRSASSLSRRQVQALLLTIREVLASAIRRRGTSISDYVDARGRRGGFQFALQVYGRQGAACPRCGTPIVRSVVAGRGTWSCPRCQRDPDSSRRAGVRPGGHWTGPGIGATLEDG